MNHIAVVLLVTLLVAAGQAAASPLVTLSNLRLGGLVEENAVDSITNVINDADPQDAMIGASAAERLDFKASTDFGQEQPTGEDGQSQIAYPVTRSLSVGFVYNLEECEDLTEGLAHFGSVPVDYANHSLLVRANWRFN